MKNSSSSPGYCHPNAVSLKLTQEYSSLKSHIYVVVYLNFSNKLSNLRFEMTLEEVHQFNPWHHIQLYQQRSEELKDTGPKVYRTI